MASARSAIQKICDERRVAPLEMLGVLLEALQQSQTFHAGLSVADPSRNATVEGEIEALCAMVNSDRPKHLLETLRLAVFAWQLPAMINARDARARGDEVEAGSLERSVQIGDALRQLLDECIIPTEDLAAADRPTIVERSTEGFDAFRKGPPGDGGTIGELPFE